MSSELVAPQDFQNLSRCEALMLVREINKDFADEAAINFSAGFDSAINQAQERVNDFLSELGIPVTFTFKIEEPEL